VLSRRSRLVALVVFVAGGILTGFLVFPAGVRGVVGLLRPPTPLRDTVALAGAERLAGDRLAAAESLVTATRRQLQLAQAAHAAASRSLPQVDSIVAQLALIEPLMQRAENAPLPETFRAIATSPTLSGDARVSALLDSLADVERERDEFGAGAAVDPVFVALTTRANALGRSIVAIADARRAALRRQLDSLQARASARAAPAPLPDTTGVLAQRDAAARDAARARQALDATRAANAAAVAAAAREREAVQLAPVPVLALAALVIAAALVFALSLGDEIRSPRIADAAEAERLSNARVLTVVRTRDVPADRLRRAADRERPPLLDPGLDAYRMVAWHVSAHAPRDGLVVVTGDSAPVRAIIAANIAAVLADEARATLLVDIDFERRLLADILRVPVVPGIAAVLENRRRWPEAVVQVTTGRGRTLDIIPSGLRARPLGPAEAEALGGEIARAARRYDFTVVQAPLRLARRVLLSRDTVLCATVTRTRLATLARGAATLRSDGSRVLGVALWEGPLPSLQEGSGRWSPRSEWARRSRDAA
jgi:Mrp family chromosome partitioning ATPase